MKPYYDADGITIYNGDCREILPSLTFDAINADPPYGVAERTNRKAAGRSNLTECNDFDAVYGDDEPFDPAWLLSLNKPTLLWGANHYADKLPPSPSWIVWDKRDGITSNDNADCEMAWTNIGGPARLFVHRWSGMIKASEKDQRRVHPTQKPVALASWTLQRMTGVVVDPYMGAGYLLVAAQNLGRHAIGIEIEERYCETAAKRLAQRTLFGGTP